jgi:hypothetical protein
MKYHEVEFEDIELGPFTFLWDGQGYYRRKWPSGAIVGSTWDTSEIEKATFWRPTKKGIITMFIRRCLETDTTN